MTSYWWAKPKAARKFHAFTNNDHISLCRWWDKSAPADASMKSGEGQCCKACLSTLERRLAA